LHRHPERPGAMVVCRGEPSQFGRRGVDRPEVRPGAAERPVACAVKVHSLLDLVDSLACPRFEAPELDAPREHYHPANTNDRQADLAPARCHETSPPSRTGRARTWWVLYAARGPDRRQCGAEMGKQQCQMGLRATRERAEAGKRPAWRQLWDEMPAA